MACCKILPTAAVVGFQKTSETQFEDGHVTVCVQVFSPDIRRPVAYPFEIAVTTADISAGE